MVLGTTGASWTGSGPPDGRRLALGRLTSDGPEIAIEIADLESGQITPVPGSKGLYSPRWSPDGRRVAALSRDALNLLLYDRTPSRLRAAAMSARLRYP